LYLGFVFIIGTVIGSFLNVCIHRLPRGDSIIYPASHCPHCKQRLGFVDLIPVLGYLFLRGKCRYCKTPISFRYPLVEVLSGALLVWVAWKFPLALKPLEFGFYAVFIFLMLVAFFIDLEQQVIPDKLSFSGIILGLIFNYAKSLLYHGERGLNPFLSAVYGMLLGYFFLFLIAKLGKLWFKKEVMGEGDLFLAALLGAFLGWQGVLLSLFLAYLVAGSVALIFLILGKVKMGQYVPFGPALAAGGILTLLFGRMLVACYLNMMI
jgi:leader peptidase (prepilin peptidase)/N-methyltransferase